MGWQRSSFQTGGRKKWSRARSSRPNSRPGEQEELLCIRWNVCVCVGGWRVAGGRWTPVPRAHIAGGCSENINYKRKD